jgi:hypothetical protein
MKETYRAKIISISGNTVTYEYSDRNGFVQISSLRPSGIKVSVGDSVWITVEDGEVITVTKRRSALSTPFGAKLIGMLVMIIVLLVLWLIFVIIKKVIIAFVWIFVIVIAGVFLFAKLKR